MKHNEKCFKLTGKTYINDIPVMLSSADLDIHDLLALLSTADVAIDDILT